MHVGEVVDRLHPTPDRTRLQVARPYQTVPDRTRLHLEKTTQSGTVWQSVATAHFQDFRMLLYPCIIHPT